MPLVSFSEACEILTSGELLVFPTETVFGIGCDAKSQSGVDSILSLKTRSCVTGMPILVPSLSVVNDLVIDATSELLQQREELQDRFWPGALTIVVDVKEGSGFARGVAASDGSVAMRFSSLHSATKLAQSVGGCLVATSANQQGARPVCTTEEALSEFPDLPVIAGICEAKAVPSTIVDVRSLPAKIIRQGVLKLPDLSR